MRLPVVRAVALLFALAGSAWAGTAVSTDSAPASAVPAQHKELPLGPPTEQGPVVVKARFALTDINAIDDTQQTLEFSGVLTLSWHDPRQAFDPAITGVRERIFQGAYQFDEIAPGWYPQIVLVNRTGSVEQSAVLLRVQPDGGCTLVQTLHAVAKTRMDLHLYPFDRHRLEAVFDVLGFGADEVVLQADPADADGSVDDIEVPQWDILGLSETGRDRPAPYAAGISGLTSTFVVGFDVERQSAFILRLVIVPLIVIVLLSFCVFWMDRSSLGDRISVSFLGILTGVTFQIVMAGTMPSVSHGTVVHGLLNLSFLTMCATVLINLWVGALDKQGRHAAGDRIDRRCRWLFPASYLGGSLVIVGGFLLVY